MPLATRVRPFVSRRTAAAGRALFARGSVSILDGSEDSVVAAVRGRDVYRTEAAWSGGNLRISCTCPGFEGAGGPCAHLWASLLLADDRGLLETGLDGSRFRLIAPIALDRADRRVSAPSVGADDPDDPPVPTAGSPHPAVAIDFVPALRLFAPRAPRDGAVVDRPVYVLDREASRSSPGVVLDFLVQRRGSRRPVPARQVKLPIAHPRSIRDGQIAARLFDAIEQGWDGARPESLAIEGPVTLDDGTFGVLPESWLKMHRLLVSSEPGTDGRLRFRRSQVALLVELTEKLGNATGDRTFEQARSDLEGFDGIAPGDPLPGFGGDLRAYQRTGLGWLRFLHRFRLGGCLADDMGLGKTIQALAFLDERAAARRDDPSIPPSLVVAPRSLVFNWKSEAERFAPRIRVLEHTGSARASTPDDLALHDVVLTTYGTLRETSVCSASSLSTARSWTKPRRSGIPGARSPRRRAGYGPLSGSRSAAPRSRIGSSTSGASWSS